MHTGPSRIAESMVAMLLPPACREEIVGDLHERFTSPPRYALDALRTVPLVVISRIRMGALWLGDRAFLEHQWALLRFAIPPAIATLGWILAAAYTKGSRGPACGVIFAFASQEILRIGTLDVALPRWPLAYGCALSLLLAWAIRLLLQPVARQPRRPLR